MTANIGHAFETGSALINISSEINEEDRQRIKTAIMKSTKVVLIEPASLRPKVSELSKQVPKINDRAFRTQLRQARDYYVNLKLDRADRAYERALKELFEHPLSLPNTQTLARIYFEKSQISNARKRKGKAKQELSLAIRLNPRLVVDPNEYGPPVVRAVQREKRKYQSSRKRTIQINRAPQDAVVYVNGQEVQQNGKVQVRGRGPHLVTARRLGFRSYIKFHSLRPNNGYQEIAMVMKAAQGPVLAQQILRDWAPDGRISKDVSSALPRELALQLAKLSNIPEVFEATASESDHIEVKRIRVLDEEITVSVRGRSLSWEPWAFALLSEALAGRTLERPDPKSLILALSAPTRVNATEDIEVLVQIRDTAAELRALRAKCGEEEKVQKIQGIQQGALSMSLRAPSERAEIQCSVVGLDAAGKEIVRSPPKDRPVKVFVEDPRSTPWYGRWYVWTAIVGAVAAGGASAAYFSFRGEPPEEHRLVFNAQ
ncbi:MAG: hypothetical protein VYC39_06765 [Myxococcota bacterium]|nr:hypothetical protein [Myxococcota bacterium]